MLSVLALVAQLCYEYVGAVGLAVAITGFCFSLPAQVCMWAVRIVAFTNVFIGLWHGDFANHATHISLSSRARRCCSRRSSNFSRGDFVRSS